MKFYPAFIWAALLSLCAPFALADTLILDDNEVFRGDLVRISNGVVVFRPKLAGQMMVTSDTVRSLETDRNLVISLTDESVLYGRLSTRDEQLHVLPLDGAEAIPIKLEAIDQALAIPNAPRSDENEAYSQWRSSVETGVMTRFGSRSVADAIVRIETERSGGRVALRADATTGLPLEDGEFRYFQGRLVLHDGEDGLAPYASLGLDRNTEEALTWRTDLTLGLRRAWQSPENGHFEALLGLGVAWESWRNDAASQWPWDDRSVSDTDFNLQLGLRYKRNVLGQGAFTGALNVLPSLSNAGEFRALSSAELRYPLTPRLYLRFDLRLDYDSDRPFRHVEPLEGGLGAGVGLSF